MPPFAKKFSEDQKALILHACVDSDGPRMTIPRAVDAAARRELVGQTAPFVMTKSYAYDLCRAERKTRAGIPTGATHDTADTQLERIVRRMLVSLDAGTKAYERRAKLAEKSDTRKGPNPSDLVALARAGQEIRKLMIGDTRKPARPQTSPSDIKGAAPDTEIDGMVQAMRNDGRDQQQVQSAHEGAGPPHENDQHPGANTQELDAAPTKRSAGGNMNPERAEFLGAIAGLEGDALASHTTS